MRKVFVVGGLMGLREFFLSNGYEPTDNPIEADLFQFLGGEDVSPVLYGAENTASHNNFHRDMLEMAYFTLARRTGKPMVGICRGGQFLNVMCGGKMIQDVKGHTRSHPIYNEHGPINVGEVTSTHHQMMVPNDFKAKLLAWGITKLSDEVSSVDPEIIFYEEDKCLCFQPHPEYKISEELESYYFSLINRYLFNGGENKV